jgi:CRP-like cAMP-binding protein
VDGEPRRELRAGDIFGELAALDWGSGYGYSRTATVRALTRMRLLVIAADDLRRLIADLPVVEERIRAAVRRHLQ